MNLAPHDRSISRQSFLSQCGAATIGASLSACALHPRLRGAEPNREAAITAERVFHESAENIPNPERGFYAQRSSHRLERLDNLRAQGITLLLVTFDLRDFKERDVTPDKLEELRRALGIAREHGFKVIFRAAYGFTGQDYRVDPKDLNRIVRHIAQMGEVLTENRDLVWAIQAGMLGPWGEWHGSNHGNTPSIEARRAVLWAWLDAVPAPITVHIRRPMFIRDLFAGETGGFDLTESTAFSGSKLSRVGWHDDSFLVRPTDAGTYAERGWDRARELDWCRRHGRFTPFGGETVHTDNPMPAADVIREMELLHATYLNIGYHPRVLQLWRETEHQGERMFDHIARRLGYRLVAERLRYGRLVGAGGSLPWELTLKNNGFASPHLPRSVAVALLRTSPPFEPVRVVELQDADPRWWGPEAGTIQVSGRFPVPADAARGNYGLALRLADASERLREDSRYAIRFANRGVPFTAEGGWNILAEDITVA
jgi:hypothetical protein